HTGLTPGGEAVAWVRGHDDDVGGMLPEELGGVRHRIGAGGLDLLDVDAEPRPRRGRAAGRQHPPALEGLAHAREMLPARIPRVRRHVENAELAAGEQGELERVREGQLAGLGEVCGVEEAPAHGRLAYVPGLSAMS